MSTIYVRQRIGDLLNRVALRHDEFVIERKGKPLAALIPGTQGADPILTPRGPVQTIIQVLDDRPDLIPTVLELLEMALERERQTLPGSGLLPAHMPNE